ncbi:MAG TPA: PqqD family protein [Candidatus Sulfotelmatobacter sp.]|jgi:hypothetical protein|nr:PqqD family protein [Candidatus Sulfotelmatobacter sp.]
MSATISLQTIVVAAPEQVSTRLEDETVLLELKKGMYYGLNAVGTLIWEMVQQPRSLEALYAAVLDQYNVDPETGKRDVLRLIEEMRMAGLVEIRSAL